MVLFILTLFKIWKGCSTPRKDVQFDRVWVHHSEVLIMSTNLMPAAVFTGRQTARCSFLTYWEDTEECRIYKVPSAKVPPIFKRLEDDKTVKMEDSDKSFISFMILDHFTVFVSMLFLWRHCCWAFLQTFVVVRLRGVLVAGACVWIRKVKLLGHACKDMK